MYGALLGMIWFIPYGRALVEACLLTMIIAWLAKRFLLFKEPLWHGLDRGFGYSSSGMGWPLIAIGLLIVLTIPFSHYPALSLKKFFSRYLQQIFIMYAVAEIIHNRQRLYIVLATLLLMVFFVSTTALGQYIWHSHHAAILFGRVTGPMHHPNDLGTLLVTVLPVALVLMITCRCWFLSLFRSSQPPGWQMLLIGGVIVALFLVLVTALGLTSSRGAWVAFVVSMVALGVCLKRYKLTVLIILMLVAFFWIFGMYCLSTRIDIYSVPMYHSLVMKPTWTNPWGLPAQYNALQLLFGTSGREFYWDTAVNVIKKYPWFGCGYNAYVQTLKDLQVGHTEYPHNSLLHIMAELGLVGVILYGWLFVALCLKIKNVLRVVSRERDLFLLGCGISCGILAWMVHSLLDTPWSSLQLSLLLWVLIGILISLGLIIPNDKGEKPCL